MVGGVLGCSVPLGKNMYVLGLITSTEPGRRTALTTRTPRTQFTETALTAHNIHSKPALHHPQGPLKEPQFVETAISNPLKEPYNPI